MIPSQTCSYPTYLQLCIYLSFPPFHTMNSSISKVAVGPHDADDPQDPHLDGAVDDPQIPCLDADAEVSNLEVDHALPKKPRAKPKPIRRKKGKLSKIRPKKSPVVPLPPSQPQSISWRPVPVDPPTAASVTSTMHDWTKEKLLRKYLDLVKINQI